MNDTSDKIHLYLDTLNKSFLEVIEVSAQTRSCVANLLKLGNEIDTARLRKLIDVIEVMDSTADYLRSLLSNHQKMMAAKPGEIIVLD